MSSRKNSCILKVNKHNSTGNLEKDSLFNMLKYFKFWNSKENFLSLLQTERKQSRCQSTENCCSIPQVLAEEQVKAFKTTVRLFWCE